MLNKNNTIKFSHPKYNSQALLSTSGSSCCCPKHFSTGTCLLEKCKSEEKSQILSGRNAAAFLKDCARGDLFFRAETKLENDSPENEFNSVSQPTESMLEWAYIKFSCRNRLHIILFLL